ncbi:hypothetical protein B6U66_01195 [Candidatus Bathyarchaeota archaeon ex4484_135]|nr:MAG: hypothetical protein B6U66_01195 [Candidatus Bathyarchaeota archaeon ex4484_135]
MAKVYAMFIMNKDGIPLFSRNLAPEKIQPDLIASFLTAIGSFVKEISPIGGPALRCIEAKGFTIMIETGQKVYGALIVDHRSLIAEEYLRALVREFEELYGPRLEAWDNDTSLFEPFGEVCDRVMSVIAVSSYHVPRLGQVELGKDVTIPRELWAVLRFVDGRRTVAEIAAEAGLSVDEAIHRIEKLVEMGLVDVNISEPVRKVAKAYEEALNEYLKDLRDLLGYDVVKAALSRAVASWGQPWLNQREEGGIEVREADRLAWLHTPNEVSEMFKSFFSTLSQEVKPLMGVLASDIIAKVQAAMRTRHGEEFRKFGA